MRERERDPEARRLAESGSSAALWRRWGPYVAERAWGTVREDYSADGEAWKYLPHDHARSRAYRWNEDGIAGLCDRHGLMCFAPALWNERDPILKERLFGLDSLEGNHGEDVKEIYYYLDNTPTHSYARALYVYPQRAFPYDELVAENQRRTKLDGEFELVDTGVLAGGHWEVFVEYAKADAEDILIRITAVNRGTQTATLHVLPTLWFRNTWSWGVDPNRPRITQCGDGVLVAGHPRYGDRFLHAEGAPPALFTENETNAKRLFGAEDGPAYAKDAFHEYLVQGRLDAVNPNAEGSKAAFHYRREIAPGASLVLRLRVTPERRPDWLDGFDAVIETRRAEADAFYAARTPEGLDDDRARVVRQAYAGLLWSKQFYHYVVEDWLYGDGAEPRPPSERLSGRNRHWTHLYNADVILMPDKWEYPWYAAWDLAFHAVALARIDPDLAKEQLILMLREWYMHPNGQLPAYEWGFDDVNPPVHAWAALRVFRIERELTGHADHAFLARVFHKLLLNFTWWVNRKDEEGNNLFEGGFLGLDNIGVFDRSRPLPGEAHLEQSDGTSWMAMYALDLLAIALELAKRDPTYQDVASKFWEHFVFIAFAMNHRGTDNWSMWNDEDGFYYDVLHLAGDGHVPIRVRSMVGLIPLFAAQVLEAADLDAAPEFVKRRDWFIENRPDLLGNCASVTERGPEGRRLLSIVDPVRLRRILQVMLDENEFLSPFGVRSMSRAHRDRPFVIQLGGAEHSVEYEPGESRTAMFGGNSNWRGPIWFPVNYLLIEALETFHRHVGDGFTVECPTGSGRMLTLEQVACELARRLIDIFVRDGSERRPVNGGVDWFDRNPHLSDYIWFYEYFHGDSGKGLGASHQTGWTALVADLIARFTKSACP